MTPQSIVTIHMVSSVDGFIARKDGDMSWMRSQDHYENGIELTDEFIKEVLDDIDCYVMGSKTYEDALTLGWPYGIKPVYVLSKRHFKNIRNSVCFYKGDPSSLINDILRPRFKNIWMVGGSQMTMEFLKSGLADEIVISIIPIILGDGVLFFDFIGKEIPLHLKEFTCFKDGMVEMCYKIL